MKENETIEFLLRGTETIVSKEELLDRLSKKKQLSVKLGVDPTSPELHLGHMVIFKILRRFQDLGHKVQIVIGSFTALVGDPSGKKTTRPVLTSDEIRKNTKRYREQALLVLDENKTEFLNNNDWLGSLSAAEILKICQSRSLNRIIERDDFRGRLERGESIRVHEILYPIFQAHDSVVMCPDIEMGGTDQIPNFMTTRQAMKESNQDPEIVLTVPLLVGLDGKKKMSKSYDNDISLEEDSKDMYGKLMSLPDSPMRDYFYLLTDTDEKEISEILKMHPMKAKKILAFEITSFLKGEDSAKAAQDYFEKTIQKKITPKERELFKHSGKIGLLEVVYGTGKFQSKGEVKRLIIGGGVKLNDDRIKDWQFIIKPKFKGTIKAGKRFWFDLEVL